MYAVIAPAATVVHVVAVTPGGNFSINLTRVWKRVLEEQRVAESGANAPGMTSDSEEDGPDSRLPSDCSFTTKRVKTRRGAWLENSAGIFEASKWVCVRYISSHK